MQSITALIKYRHCIDGPGLVWYQYNVIGAQGAFS